MYIRIYKINLIKNLLVSNVIVYFVKELLYEFLELYPYKLIFEFIIFKFWILWLLVVFASYIKYICKDLV